MEVEQILRDFGLILSAGLIAQFLATITRVPEMILLVAAGAVVGPSDAGSCLQPARRGRGAVALQLGVALILFHGGVGISLRVPYPRRGDRGRPLHGLRAGLRVLDGAHDWSRHRRRGRPDPRLRRRLDRAGRYLGRVARRGDLAVVALVYFSSATLGGSAYLAAFVMGLIVGNMRLFKLGQNERDADA